MELLSVDRVVADLRVHEARQSFLDDRQSKRADFISAEVLKAEFHCHAQDISDLIHGDEDFLNDVCFHLAAFVRNHRDLGSAQRLISAFDRAIERRAALEYAA